MCGVCDNVEFIRKRDGDAAVAAFAARAAVSYRKHLRKYPSSLLRRQFISAYVVAKRIANQT